MRITVLAENESRRADMICEHGLSLYIALGNKRILFDMGQSDAFEKNARVLGIDLGKVDLAVLSHGHYDHGGGLKRFLEINAAAPVYASRYAFEPHFNARGKSIGLLPLPKGSRQPVWVEETLEICTGATLFSCGMRERKHPWSAFGQTAGDDRRTDDYRHELYLLLEEDGKRVLLSGCSHKGVANLAAWFAPTVLVGGFHTMKLSPEDPALEKLALTLQHFDTQYYTCHCTGQAQYKALKNIMGTRLQDIHCGDRIEL